MSSGPSSSLLRESGGRGGEGGVSFAEEWERMLPIVLRLLRQEGVSKAEWQGLFFSVHSLVSWADKGAERINDELKRQVLAHISEAERRIREQTEENALLKAYIGEWRRFFEQAHYLPMPFLMVEPRSPRLQPKQRPSGKTAPESSVRRMMLEAWNSRIFAGISGRLQSAAMRQVASERNGEAFDSQLVVGVRESYVSLCTESDDRLAIYRAHFEAAYLEATTEFYAARAAGVLEANGVQAYAEYAEGKLAEEEARAQKYLETGHGSNSLLLLKERCVAVLLEAFKEQLLAESPELIKHNQIPKLQRLYRLMNRTASGIQPMLRDLESHIRGQGLADMVTNVETITTDPEKYVEQLLAMFRRFSELVRAAFYDDPRFLTSRDKAYRDVVNDVTVFKIDLSSSTRGPPSKTSPESKCPELLANYCDLLLRRTGVSRKLTSEEIDAKLADVLLVLKYVGNKDVFMRYHKAHLARRLILDMSADGEKEEMMVNRLREAGMPADYVNKLYRMLQDMEVCRDLTKEFRSAHVPANNNARHSIADAVQMKILNSGAWARAGERVPVSLPREMEDFIPEVEEFYKKHHSGRKLQWLHQWSNGTVAYACEKGTFDLEVTTFQMSVLFTWNERRDERISFENLRLHTELPDAELRRTLYFLVAFPRLKHQVLLTDALGGNPKEFRDSTLFWPNPDFVLVKNGKPQSRGKLNLIGRLQLSSEGRQEAEAHDDILQLRILRVQEALVKIMKMRKRIHSAQLQTELVEMLKAMFLPSRKLFKEQMEWLIENAYVRRDESDRQVFVYLA